VSSSSQAENTGQTGSESGLQPPPAPAAPSPTDVLSSDPAQTASSPPAGQMPFAPPPPSTFTLHKLGTGKGPTLLIIGGIQGDEPGGFSAAALIASHYTISSGSVWVVPGLNFSSILQRNRGVFGDMNRKFASLDASDPEYDIVRRIKSVLLDEQVSLVLNLHDGSGFYRPAWEDQLHNPNRWGQSLIIDQAEMPAPRFNHLLEIARRVEEDVNKTLLAPEHRYHIHNTLTADGNKEMAKTLSYFAVRNGKPAFGLEASKEFGTELRSYYHLRLVESFMRQMGIGFERDFPLTPRGILTALNSNLNVAAYDNKLILHLDNARPSLTPVPFKKNAAPDDVRTSKPLLALVRDKDPNGWRVAYGNRTLTRLHPDFMDFDDSLDSVEMVLDGKTRTVRMGEILSVEESFLVKEKPGYRVNAIGAQKENNGSEAGVKLALGDFMPRYSVDKKATLYRVEVYKGKAFAGMVLVRFGKTSPLSGRPLTATPGPESDFGF
jgi:hypothetical protein